MQARRRRCRPLHPAPGEQADHRSRGAQSRHPGREDLREPAALREHLVCFDPPLPGGGGGGRQARSGNARPHDGDGRRPYVGIGVHRLAKKWNSHHPAEAVKVAFCFPGQGSQDVGMGRAFAEQFAEARAVYEEASEAAGFDVARLCFEGPIEDLTRTELQQPALVATSLACLRAVESTGARPDYVIGHSVGEYSALAAAGAVSTREAVELVTKRGVAMAQAAQEYPGAMAAVLGLPDDVIEELCAEIDGVWPANYNCPGQVVVSGADASVDRLLETASSRGARKTVKLRVSGAFHSPLVAKAADRLRPVLERVRWRNPEPPFMSTVSAKVENAQRIAGLLVEQVTGPVCWTQAVAGLMREGVGVFVEIGPGQVLSGLLRRCDRSLKTISVGDPESLRRLEETLSAA